MGVTTNVLRQLAKLYAGIPCFKNVFMRTLSTTLSTVRRNESGIINLDNAEQVLIGWRMRKGEIMLYISTVLTNLRKNWCNI